MPAIQQLTTYLKNANNILVFTGAGISTESGIPDYRGPSGIWKTKQPVYYQEFMTSEAARIEYWQQKSEGWEILEQAKPNATHKAIVDLEEAGKVLMVITQNIDGLHSMAGTSREKLVELHGTGRAVECQSCHKTENPEAHFMHFRQTGNAPLCEECKGFLKPATISFGQNLREKDLQKSVEAASNCDLVVALGSSLTVNPAASITLLAAENGAPYIIINRGVTEHDEHPHLSLRLEGDVSKIFPIAVAEALA